MKVTSNKKTDTNTVELEIEVSAEELDQEIQNVYQREKENITVPGFRKGKAPRKMIENAYGDFVFVEDAVNDLYPKIYSEAIEETGIEPVAPADIEIMSLDVAEGFTFKAIVTVKPEVEIKGYKGLKAEKVVRTVSDEEIDQQIEQMRERGARLVQVERAAQEGDTAIIDFEGFVDDVAFDGGKAEGHEIVLGSHTFIEGFEDQIVGKEIEDEFDVEVTFPEEYHADELAGKPAVFKVKLHDLKEKELPELDDEFVKDVSEFDTLDELREDIKKNLQENKDQFSEDEMEDQLVGQIVEHLEGDIPEVMYEGRIDDMVNEFAQQLASQGMNMDLYLQYTGMELESFRKTFREQATRQVKVQLALEKIAELEELTASEEDYEKEYEKIAEMYGMEIDSLKEMIPAERLDLSITSNKAIDLIRENAEISEISEEEAEKKAQEALKEEQKKQEDADKEDKKEAEEE